MSKSEGRAPSLLGIPWHLPYNWGISTEKPQKKYSSTYSQLRHQKQARGQLHSRPLYPQTGIHWIRRLVDTAVGVNAFGELNYDSSLLWSPQRRHYTDRAILAAHSHNSSKTISPSCPSQWHKPPTLASLSSRVLVSGSTIYEQERNKRRWKVCHSLYSCVYHLPKKNLR